MKTKNITLCAMLAALASVIMLTSYFPYLTYGIPAIAGLFVLVAVIETNTKWALSVYFVSSVIALITAEREATVFYLLFFGVYPILKSLFEIKLNRITEYIMKFLFFNISVFLAFGLMLLLGFPMEAMNEFGNFTVYILLAAANLTFFIYDIALGRVAGFYMVRVSPAVNRIFKGQ